MLTELQIENFKGWKDTGKLRLAPITLFFGTNSSGKSSLSQFLMMLKQTANSPDRNRVLHPGDEKTPVDLGTLEDLAHHHDTNDAIRFSLEWRRPSEIEIPDVLSSDSFSSKKISFKTEISFETGKGIKAVSNGFRYAFTDDWAFDRFEAGLEPKEKKGQFDLKTKRFSATRKTGRAWPLPRPIRFFGFPDELSLYYQNADVLNDLAFDFQNVLQDLTYLGPLRDEPKRHYPWSGDTPEDVGVKGERWVSALLAASERKISSGYRKQGVPFEIWIARQLKDIGLIHSFSVEPIAKGLREYRVEVRVTRQSPAVAIPDVGFGVSQVLPIIVQSFYAVPHTTVIIEQPELHLHPAVQQNLADLFIAGIRAREGGKDRGVQFLLESHSEHFLRRLQRRIAEGELSRDDVAIYFCDNVGRSSQIEPLEVDEIGNILNWPKNFFGDQMTDVAEMQKAGIRRRRESIECNL